MGPRPAQVCRKAFDFYELTEMVGLMKAFQDYSFLNHLKNSHNVLSIFNNLENTVLSYPHLKCQDNDDNFHSSLI